MSPQAADADSRRLLQTPHGTAGAAWGFVNRESKPGGSERKGKSPDGRRRFQKSAQKRANGLQISVGSLIIV